MKDFIPIYNSIPDGFFKTCSKYGDSPAFRYKIENGKKETLTYKEIYTRVNALAKAFDIYGVKYGTHVAIFSENRIEWFLSDMALLSLGAVDVPRGNDSSFDDLSYIVEHSEPFAIIVENTMMYNKIKPLLSKSEFVLVLDSSISDEDNNVHAFSRFILKGENALNGDTNFIKERSKLVNTRSIATIIYTSGTTGCPKGVVLTHGNILHNTETVPKYINLVAGDKLVSILPIWHAYERTISYGVLLVGGFTCFSTKKDFKNDLVEEKPDVLGSVPAIWVNIHKSVMKEISKKSFLAKNMAMFVLNKSIEYTRHRRYKNDMVYLLGDETKEDYKKDYKSSIMGFVCHKLAKKLVYNKIVNLLGGRMRLTVSGGSALPMYIEDFIEACGINLVVAWGITEASPAISFRSAENNYRGTCGIPLDHIEIEVRDEDGNKCEDGKMGLCWVKGPNIFEEYYKDPKLTSKVKVDGFFNTGDLGAYTKQGEIVLTGRVKETIVLLTGENVEPQPIENKILESKTIENVVLVGQDKPTIGALIVLDEEEVKNYCIQHKIDFANKKLSELADIIKLVKTEVARLISQKTGFKPYESISKISIIDKITIENELLTQSLKVKRNEVFNRYKEVIENMYNN